MGFKDEIRKAIEDSMERVAEDDKAQREFLEDWLERRAALVIPVLETSVEAIRETVEEEEVEIKIDNGSISLIVSFRGALHTLKFSPDKHKREISCITLIGGAKREEKSLLLATMTKRSIEERTISFSTDFAAFRPTEGKRVGGDW